jgi:hypothetical protein
VRWGVTLPDVAERQDDNNAGEVPDRATIAQAATLLGCHPNTVRSRVRAGIYKAEKVMSERGPTWMIERDSLITNTPTSSRQQGASEVPVAQQEALQELARQIVMEAGLGQHPEVQARLEASKLSAEAAKTHVLLSSGALVGIAAMVSILPSSTRNMEFLLMAVLLIGLSVLFGFVRMDQLVEVVASQRQPPTRTLATLGPMFLVVGLLVFALYIFYNIPWHPQEGLLGLELTRKQVVLGSPVVAVLTTAIIFGVRALLERRKRQREDAGGRESSAE